MDWADGGSYWISIFSGRIAQVYRVYIVIIEEKKNLGL